MAKPTADASDVTQDTDALIAQVQALTEALVARDQQVQRLAETAGHLAARMFSVEFMLDLRSNAGQGLDSLRFPGGLTRESYVAILDATRGAILGG